MTSYRTASGRSIDKTLAAYGAKAEKALGKGLYREAQKILAESLPLVPVDTGALRSSGYVTLPARDGDRISVSVGYGGPSARLNPKTGQSTAGYALFVHENLEAHHKVGQALYLGQPFNAARKGIGTRLVVAMKADLSGAGPAPSSEEAAP